MGDGEIRVLKHAVLPAVFLAASAASEDSSDSSLYDTTKDVLTGSAWEVAEEHRNEVLNEYTGEDVSKEEYEQELEKTVEEAQKYGHAFVPTGSYGDEVAEYLQEHAPDVTVERYDSPTGEKKGAKGAASKLSYSEKKEAFPNYQSPHAAARKQQRTDEKIRSYAGPLNIPRWITRMGETEDSFAVPEDYRSKSPPYADMDFVMTGDTEGEQDDAGYEKEVYTSAGKQWARGTEEVDGEERVQIYENGVPKIDYGEDEETVEKQREKAENAFNAAKGHALPEYTDKEEEEYEGGVFSAIRDTVSEYISKSREKKDIREEYNDRGPGEPGVGARIGELQRIKKQQGLTAEQEQELQELHERRYELNDALDEVGRGDYVGKLRAGLQNSYETAKEKADEWNEPHPGRGPAGAKQYQQYKGLVDRLKSLNESGESALVVTYAGDDDLFDVLQQENIDYSEQNAL